MGRVIQLKNDKIISVDDNDKYGTLGDIIYDYLGYDAWKLFREYNDELEDEIAELIDDRNWWMERCNED